MAKDGNTYAKRQRETLKRQKAEAKRDRRKKRKDMPRIPAGIDHPQEVTAADLDGGAENP